MSDKPQNLGPTKIEANIATADDFRKQWEERGCPEPTLLGRLFEIDENPALAKNPEFLKELHPFPTAELVDPLGLMGAGAAMPAEAIAAYLPPLDLQSSFVAMQASLATIREDDACMLKSAKMMVATVAGLDSKAIEASAVMAARAIADYASLADRQLSIAAMQPAWPDIWRAVGWTGRGVDMAFRLQVESLKAEEVWKTYEQAAGFQAATRIIKEMSSAESLYGFSAVEALLPRYTPALDLGLAAFCNIGSSKATAAKSRPVQDRNRRGGTQPQIILSLATTTSATTGNPTVVHGPSCSVSTAFVVAPLPPASAPEGEDEILRRMLTEGNAAAVVAHLRHQMGVRPKKRGRPASKRELYAQAAHMREQESLSWAQLARKYGP